MVSIRLVGIDIDGTLLNPDGEISPATLAALRRLHARGLLLALVTGRRFRTAAEVGRAIDLPVLLGVHNGAALHRIDGTLLYAETLPQEETRIACRVGRDAGAFAWVYRQTPDAERTAIFCERATWPTDGLGAYVRRYYERNREFIVVQDDLSRRFEGDALEVMLTADCAIADEVAARVGDALGKRARVIKEISSGIAHIEVAHPRVSKARPLEYLADREGLTPANVMAIGDNFNDLDMLRYAGHPVVMGNAQLQLRNLGYRVAPTNAEDGLAQVLAELD